ncbi:hypothetical protein [Actinomadura sp. 9N407]|uniref:hypothetical protein n=1 Tax=Actinomadura sp. 9N407 TaxID=3375154 RepID=UPI0037B33186
MRLRLAGGVVAAPGLAAWAPRRSGPVRLTGEGEAEPGAAVALGPATADAACVERAVAGLARLVRDGGVVAAGAGIDLGDGFRTARLEGAQGDQRDAVLAALKVLGIEDADRLGARAGFLVALFGPSVTKPVGAAAANAIAEGRWAALHLATAASDVLGPEQLERILALTVPDGADLISGGLPSALAVNLRQALAPVPRPRRLKLLTDLWERASEHHREAARAARRMASQGRQTRRYDLRKRNTAFEDELLLAELRSDLGSAREPSLADAARWRPTDFYWDGMLNRIGQDAHAATALVRTAVAVADHGFEEGLARSAALLAATDGLLPEMAKRSGKRVPGLTGLPARPGFLVRQIHHRLDGHERSTKGGVGESGVGKDGAGDLAKLAAYVGPRLTHARDYAWMVLDRVRDLIDGDLGVPEDNLRRWASAEMREWREAIGEGTVRSAFEWVDAAAWRLLNGDREPIATRLERLDVPNLAEVEVVGDLLWCAELADALAPLYGHRAAKVDITVGAPWLDPDPEITPEPLEPPLGSLTLAIAGAAQLVALGGAAPVPAPARSVRTWTDFTASLRAGAEIAEALGGEFALPATLAAVDGASVPGTGARFRLARGARTLAEWANYMGNCISGPWYLENAEKGWCGLAALHADDGRILVNLELSPRRPAVRGWQVTEIAARFNEAPDADLERRIRDWVGTIPGSVEDPEAEPPVPEEDLAPGRTVRRRPRPRLLQEAGPALGGLAERAWAEQLTGAAVGALAVLAGSGSGPGGGPEASLTRLRRLGPVALTNTVRNGLGDGGLDLVDLWTLSSIRPLETAMDGLAPVLRDRFENLHLLLGDTPLPGSLRKLVRRPAVAPAYSMGLMALRLRAAIGRLVDDGDPLIARAVSRRTTEPLLCALVVTVTCGPARNGHVPVAPPRTDTVPGFPVTSLDDEDGPWQRALPAARELGADTAAFRERISEDGLRIPATWLKSGGWNALWSRAHRAGRSARAGRSGR